MLSNVCRAARPLRWRILQPSEHLCDYVGGHRPERPAPALGLANGLLFGRILAFSPGFAAPPRTEGRPGVFISHGTGDEVLPIDACSRRLVPQLRRAGYEVRYREFAGSHAVPGGMVDDALGWTLLR